jgi:hypothetical protein
MKTLLTLFLLTAAFSAASPPAARAAYACSSAGHEPLELRVEDGRLELPGSGTYTPTGRHAAGRSEFAGDEGLLAVSDSLLEGGPEGRLEWESTKFECGPADELFGESALTASTRCTRRVMTIHGPVIAAIPCPNPPPGRRPPPRPRPLCHRTLRGCGGPHPNGP